MKIDQAGDLIHLTYYMMDWNKAKQESSDRTCQECGQKMNKVDAVVDARGSKYDGYVCHQNKILIWVRAD